MRALGWPAVVLAELLLVVLSPLLLLLAAIADLAVGGRRASRVVVIAVAGAAHALAALLACLVLWPARRAPGPHYALLRWFVASLTDVVLRSADVEVRLCGDDEAFAALSAADRPALVLARHAGEGDTLLVLDELLRRHGRRPRVVMHHGLRADPLVNVLGTRLPNRFIDPRGGDIEGEIRAMAGDLGPRDAVLVFPEGRNFSHEHRERAIDRLERLGRGEHAERARGLQHHSAPRPGGVLAALDGAPGAHVVVLAHAGVPHGLGETWRMLPERQVIELRAWLAPAPPEGQAARVDWLFGLWEAADRWVDGRPAR